MIPGPVVQDQDYIDAFGQIQFTMLIRGKTILPKLCINRFRIEGGCRAGGLQAADYRCRHEASGSGAKAADAGLVSSVSLQLTQAFLDDQLEAFLIHAVILAVDDADN